MSKAEPQQNETCEEIDYLELDQIIDKDFNGDKENLIMILQSIQRRYNYVPKPALSYLAEKLGVPYSKIYGVGTFYSTFSLEPRGRNIISIYITYNSKICSCEIITHDILDRLYR